MSTEIRFSASEEDLRILDGFIQATGQTRAEVFRLMLKDWSDARLREAMMICRVARVNPLEQETTRQKHENPAL